MNASGWLLTCFMAKIVINGLILSATPLFVTGSPAPGACIWKIIIPTSM